MYLHDLICHLVHHFTFNMPCFLCFSCINSKVYQEVSEVVWTLIYCSLNFPSVLGILSKFNCLIFFTSILLIWSWKKPQYLISFYSKYCILKCFVQTNKPSSSQASLFEKQQWTTCAMSLQCVKRLAICKCQGFGLFYVQQWSFLS